MVGKFSPPAQSVRGVFLAFTQFASSALLSLATGRYSQPKNEQ